MQRTMTLKDETKHKKAENVTATVQERYRGLFNYSKDAIVFGSMDGVLIDVNNSFSKLTGYSREELLTGKTYQDITPMEYEVLEGKVLETLLKTETPQEFEKEYIRKDGSRVPIQLTVILVKGSDDKPIALAAIIKDITERKLAEEELKKHKDYLEELVEKRTKLLRESEEKFKNLFNNSPNSICLLDKKGKINEINYMFEKTWGYSKKELIDKNFMRFQWFYQKDMPFVANTFKTLLTGNIPKPIEMRQRKKDGTHIWAHVLFSFVKIGQKEFIQVIAQDITKIKESEQKLKKSEVKYRELYEDAPNAYFSVSSDGEIMYCNRVATKILGYDMEELLNMKVTDLYFDSREGKEKAKVVFDRFLNSQVIQDEELLMRHKNGLPLWISLSVKALKDEKGKILQSRSIVIDITERKKAEEEITDALEEVKRSNAELEQFAYVASHDLQEPLRMVSGFANLLEKRYKESLDEDAHDFIDFIIDGANRMHNLINDLLAFSRIGTQGRVFKPTDMNVVLEATLNNIRISVIETNAIITNDPLPVIVADESQMVQLLQNLISNAIKFHGLVPPKIHISGEVKKDDWIFTVRDNGIGIDSKNFERIFVIFQRINKKGEYSGTGIGLAACKKIIKRHRGKIWVESELKKGSTFYFSIPRN